MLLSGYFVFLHDIKDQLTRMHRVCRHKGKDHPQCKAEYEVLDAMIDQYGDQMSKLRSQLSVRRDGKQEDEVHDNQKP
jgi:hypothetical protein